MIAEKFSTTEVFLSLDDTFNQLLQLVESIPEKQLSKVISVESWTPAQVTEHLIKSNRAIAQTLHNQGQVAARNPDERVEELKELFLNPELKFKSADFILPTRNIYPREMLIIDLKSSIAQLNEAGSKINYDELLAIPNLGELTKFEVLHLALYHTQKHIQQIKNCIKGQSINQKEINNKTNNTMTQINAYVAFNGRCREAMSFYQQCIGGDLTLQTYGETPMGSEATEEMKQQILHSSLKSGALLIMGSDMNGPEGFTIGNNIALALNCSSDEEINTFFEKLSEGGQILDPLKVQFWGGTFGALRDKFGVKWMFNYEKSQAA